MIPLGFFTRLTWNVIWKSKTLEKKLRPKSESVSHYKFQWF